MAKKIYYIGEEIKLGETINWHNLQIKVTQELINSNSDKFIIKKEEKNTPEYIKLVKSDNSRVWHYGKEGEIFKVLKFHAYNNYINSNFEVGENKYIDETAAEPATTVDWLLQKARKKYPKGTEFYAANHTKDLNNKDWSLGIVVKELNYINIISGIHICADNSNKSVYFNGSWAEIVKQKLFTTKDGIDIYTGDKTIAVNKDSLLIFNPGYNTGKSPDTYWYFKEYSNALKYTNTVKIWNGTTLYM
jgi:hypothetical protein